MRKSSIPDRDGTQRRRDATTPTLRCVRLCVLVLLACGAAAAQEPHPYAVDAPVLEPRVFAEGVVSTEDFDDYFTFTPDGRTVYFTKHDMAFDWAAIVVSHFRDGRWTTPELVPFSGRYRDTTPHLSPDGRRLFFSSHRPVTGGEPRRDGEIWYCDRTGTGWSEPKHLGSPINSDGTDWHPTVTADGTLYFVSDREAPKGANNIYRARLVDGAYPGVEMLGDAVNTDFHDMHASISADGRTLFFVSAERPDGLGADDLYVSFLRDGTWTPARNLGPRINSRFYEYSAKISPDGRYLFFCRGFGDIWRPEAKWTAGEIDALLSSSRNGLANIYQIDLAVALGEAPAATGPPYAVARSLAAPELFAEGVVSTGRDETGGSFTPDGRSLYFRKGMSWSDLSVVLVTHYRDGRWTGPEVAAFSGRHRDRDPFVAPDGSAIVFASDRPVEPGTTKADFDLWMVERTTNGWGEPRHLGPEVNSPADEQSPSLAADGTLYFTSRREGGRGNFDVWRASRAGGAYAAPENLGPTINTEGIEAFVAVDAPGRRLVVSAVRPEGLGSLDLYLSVSSNGAWSPLRHLGDGLNSPNAERTPAFTPDGRYLLFASTRGIGRGKVEDLRTYDELTRRLRSARNGSNDLYLVEAPR